MNTLKEKNRRILVVDDEVDILEILTIKLELMGWEITAVPSAKQALEELEKQAYFLVITDIAMPEMDGYEFISSVKERGYPNKLALMTGFGYDPKHTLIRINRTIKCPCLSKPFKDDRVKAAVNEAYEMYHRDI
ncbi:MAG: response regulator [Chitinispirillales bacterium]|jgi:DNA-binding NtrC family response regulator|nr:response regulator [Chitinispirillales bacterium]